MNESKRQVGTCSYRRNRGTGPTVVSETSGRGQVESTPKSSVRLGTRDPVEPTHATNNR